MDVSQNEEHDPLIDTVSMVWLNNYLIAAAAALYIYDYLLTIDLEVAFIWPSKLSAIKILYLIQRYLPFLDAVVLVLAHAFFPFPNLNICKTAFKTAAWLFLCGIGLSEVVLTRRVFAVLGNTRRNICIFLVIFILVCWIPNFVLMGHYLNSLSFDSIPLPGMDCFTSAGSRSLSFCWILLATYDAGILIVMTVFGLRSYTPGCPQSKLSHVVYRDGVIYYLYLFLLSASNVIVVLRLPPDEATLLASLERVTHSMLTSRVVLHIREVAHREVYLESSSGDNISPPATMGAPIYRGGGV